MKNVCVIELPGSRVKAIAFIPKANKDGRCSLRCWLWDGENGGCVRGLSEGFRIPANGIGGVEIDRWNSIPGPRCPASREKES